MSQMAVASSEMLEELPPTFPISEGISFLVMHTISFESIWGNQSIPS
jgi:hypothetical protein